MEVSHLNNDITLYNTKINRNSIDNLYSILGSLGSGSSAEVYLGIHRKSKEQVAVKIINKNAVRNSSIKYNRERNVLKRFVKHPFIPSLLDTFEDDDNFYLIMELIQGEELFERIVTEVHLSETEAKLVFDVLVRTIADLHHNNTAHRDLKPSNICFFDKNTVNNIRLIDFGLSVVLSDNNERCDERCGTPGYCSPEIAFEKDYNPFMADMYSLGVILYEMLCGYPCFNDEDASKVLYMHKNDKVVFHDPYWANISDEAKDLIKRLMEKNPKKRLTAVDALNHPWLKNR